MHDNFQSSKETNMTTKFINISSLPDVLLERIFNYLPLADLFHFHLSLVCHRWKKIQSSACKSITQLTILVGDNALKELESEKSKIFRIPHFELLKFEDSQKKIVKKDNHGFLTFDWLDEHSVKFIIHHLPSITCLKVVISQWVPHFLYQGEKSWRQQEFVLNSVSGLIFAYAPQLLKFKLYNKFRFREAHKCCNLKQPLTNLFFALNRCEKLQHLTLEMGSLNPVYPTFSKSLKTKKSILDLKILAILEEFHFNFYDYSTEILKSLSKYAFNNDRLRSVNLSAIGNAELGKPFFRKSKNNLKQKLFSKFHQLPDFQIIDAEEDISLLTETFPSIVKLTVNVFTLTELHFILNKLAKLTKLVFLELCFHFNPEDEMSGYLVFSEIKEIFSLNSVKILKICNTLESHDDLHRFCWEKLLPNLEILEFDDGKMICEKCQTGFDIVGDNQNPEVPVLAEPENRFNINMNNFLDAIDHDIQRQNKCNRLALQAWKNCPKLHTVFSGFATDLKKWSFEELQWTHKIIEK